MPFAFPALGRDVSTDCRTHPVDLSAQKLSLSAPKLAECRRATSATSIRRAKGPLSYLLGMDVGLIAGIVMLIVWAAGAFALDAPGWIHVLLSGGMFLIIWRISALTVRRRSARAERDSGG